MLQMLCCTCRHQKSWTFCLAYQLLFTVEIILLLNFTSAKVEIRMDFMAILYWVRI